MIADATLVKEMKQCFEYLDRLRLAQFVILILLVGLVGCAGKTRTQELLVKDYVAMSNDDLLLHYYQLEDQIVVDERASTGSSVSLGLGTGLFRSGSHFGGGLGISTGVGSQVTATELRDRRNEVRLELRKRGVNP
jgi:hypothetical protein